MFNFDISQEKIVFIKVSFQSVLFSNDHQSAILVKFQNANTLKSGIVVLVGIIVLVGTFGKMNKRTGGNKRTGWHFYRSA